MRRLHLALVLALTGVGCGRAAVDVPRLVAARGLDGVAETLQLRLARAPRDRDLHAALAAIEEQRGRPGAALDHLDRAIALGRPFRGGLDAGDRARLARLLTRRALARAARRSPGADADVARLRGLGVDVPLELVHDAGLAAVAVELRHTDPVRRAAAVVRLTRLDPALASALTGAADPSATERAARWLDAAGARRVLHEQLDEFERRAGIAGFAASSQPAWLLDRWLDGRRWWHGDDGRPDLSTLARALAAGADPCVFPRFEPARVACTGPTVEAPAATAPTEPPLPATWPAFAVALAADPADADLRASLGAVAQAFTTDPALGDRAVEDFLAASLDVAEAAPAAARLMALLGDPARARALWQRAVDADPVDPALLLGLTLAAADAGDADAALQLAIDAAAASGDAGGTLLATARGFAAADQSAAALTLARQAFELAPPGQDGPPAALAAALLDELGRPADATALRALARTPSAWDLGDERTTIAGWRSLAAAPPTRAVAMAGLARLAHDRDPARQRLAAAALRDLIESQAPSRGLRSPAGR